MPRTFCVALIAILCFTFITKGDEPDPTNSPIVKKALEKAAGDLGRHRKTYKDARAKVIAEAEKA